MEVCLELYTVCQCVFLPCDQRGLQIDPRHVRLFWRHTHTHSRTSILVRTLVDIMHSLTPYPDFNHHHNQMSNPNPYTNQNQILSLLSSTAPHVPKQLWVWRLFPKVALAGQHGDTHSMYPLGVLRAVNIWSFLSYYRQESLFNLEYRHTGSKKKKKERKKERKKVLTCTHTHTNTHTHCLHAYHLSD